MTILLFCCMVCIAVLGSISPPAHGALAVDPVNSNTLYASLDTGIFKSTDGGATWTASNQGLGDAIALRFVIDPTSPMTLYAVAGSEGIFKSTDGGAHWIPSLQNSTDTPIITLAIDPRSPTILYAGTNGNGVLKSTDGGVNWTVLNHSFTTSDSRLVRILVVDPQTPTTLYAGTNGGLFKSTDSGTTWTALNSALGAAAANLSQISVLAIDPTISTILYLSPYPGRIFKSSDGAVSWLALNSGWSNAGIEALVIDPQTPTSLYAVIYMAGIFKSTDGGSSWTAINSGLPLYSEARFEAISFYVISLAIDPKTPTTLYAQASSNSGEGIFKSTNGGVSWIFSNLGSPGLKHSP